VLQDGQAITAGGAELVAAFRPGHSLGDTALINGDWAIVGDHLLADSPIVALIDRPLAEAPDPAARPRPVLGYRRSLGETDADVVGDAFPGHGRPVVDVHGTIAKRYAQQQRKAERLRCAIGAGPRTAWQLCEEIWDGAEPDPRHLVPHAFILFCDVLGHLDLLVDEGRVSEITLDSSAIAFMPSH
jgi:glyoxylase-like metal-dependent hydrolase (beta-lactamase superfamily II)